MPINPAYDPIAISALNIAMHLLDRATEDFDGNFGTGGRMTFTKEERDTLLMATLLNYAPSRAGDRMAMAHDSLMGAQSPEGQARTREALARQAD